MNTSKQQVKESYEMITLPGLKVIESWDKNPKRNMGRYLGNKCDFVALSKHYTGTEFVTYFTEGKKFSWLLKLWAKLNGINL